MGNVTGRTQALIWNSLCDADTRQRYWGLLAQRYTTIETWMAIGISVFSASAVVVWWTDIVKRFGYDLDVSWQVPSIVAAILSAIFPVMNLSKKAETTVGLGFRNRRLMSKCELLWARLEQLSEEKALEEYNAIREEEDRIYEIGVRLGVWKGLLKESEKQMSIVRSQPEVSK